jgi:hypothetical protein
MILVRATLDPHLPRRQEWAEDLRAALEIQARWMRTGWPEPELIDPVAGPIAVGEGP